MLAKVLIQVNTRQVSVFWAKKMANMGESGCQGLTTGSFITERDATDGRRFIVNTDVCKMQKVTVCST